MSGKCKVPFATWSSIGRSTATEHSLLEELRRANLSIEAENTRWRT